MQFNEALAVELRRSETPEARLQKPHACAFRPAQALADIGQVAEVEVDEIAKGLGFPLPRQYRLAPVDPALRGTRQVFGVSPTPKGLVGLLPLAPDQGAAPVPEGSLVMVAAVVCAACAVGNRNGAKRVVLGRSEECTSRCATS